MTEETSEKTGPEINTGECFLYRIEGIQNWVGWQTLPDFIRSNADKLGDFPWNDQSLVQIEDLLSLATMGAELYRGWNGHFFRGPLVTVLPFAAETHNPWYAVGWEQDARTSFIASHGRMEWLKNSAHLTDDMFDAYIWHCANETPV